jgi:predicted Fe-Mo cluster-binding NifX family protein
MKIGIPVWNGFVSSVFDFAHQLAVVDAKGHQVVRRSQIGLREQPMQRRAEELIRLGIDVLICGAISRSLASMLVASNIEVIPFVSGSVDSVLDAYFAGRLSEPQFLQPGCRSGARNRFCHRHAGRHRHSGGRRQCQ